MVRELVAITEAHSKNIGQLSDIAGKHTQAVTILNSTISAQGEAIRLLHDRIRKLERGGLLWRLFRHPTTTPGGEGE